MTDAQKDWLAKNPNYSIVKHIPVVSLKAWVDQGYLWDNGKFSADDGKTLFWRPRNYIRVGRHVEIF